MGRRARPAKWILEMLPKKCVNCGATSKLGYHHIVPIAHGGNEVPSNYAVLCGDCHSRVHYGKTGVIDHGDLVKAGIARARANGVHLGRKCADGEDIIRAIAENSTQFNPNSTMTENEIMDMMGVRSVCYHKYKRRLMEQLDSDTWPYDWEKPKMRLNRPLYDRVIKKMRGDATA